MSLAAKSSFEDRHSGRPLPDAQPVRRCVGCGRRSAQDDLLRLTLDRQVSPTGVLPDVDHRRSGRGAYLCFKQACLDEALHRKAFQRAFRATVSVDRERVAAVIAFKTGIGEANDLAGV
jgi:uncharacterized protein